MKFAFIARLRTVWPLFWLCSALGASRSSFHAWLGRRPRQRAPDDERIATKVRASFLASDRTYGARGVWHDVLTDGIDCGLHKIERSDARAGASGTGRRRGLPPDKGKRAIGGATANILDRQFAAAGPNQKWVAGFTYIWTAEGWLYVAVVIDLFSRRVVATR